MKRKTKQVLKTLVLSALGIGAVIGAASGINALVEKNDTDLKTIYPVFEIGGLNETDGKYEKSDSTLYTKAAFECQGLEIKVDFDNYIKYQIFYYEDDGDFISATNVAEGNNKIEVPGLATHARIELTPNWAEMGEDYEEEENQIVKWYETTKYSSQIDIKVSKEQKMDMNSYLDAVIGKGRVNSFEYNELGKGLYTTSGTFDNSNENGIWYCSTKELLRFTKQADIIIVAVGTNDYYANRPLGDKYSKKTTSIYGALHTGMEYLTTFYPDSLIIYMTPYKCYRENKLYSENNNQGYNLEDVANAIKYKANQFNIPVIDLFNKSGFEDIMFDSELTDGLHPTQEFTLDVTIPMVSDFIKNNYTQA